MSKITYLTSLPYYNMLVWYMATENIIEPSSEITRWKDLTNISSRNAIHCMSFKYHQVCKITTSWVV